MAVHITITLVGIMAVIHTVDSQSTVARYSKMAEYQYHCVSPGGRCRFIITVPGNSDQDGGEEEEAALLTQLLQIVTQQSNQIAELKTHAIEQRGLTTDVIQSVQSLTGMGVQMTSNCSGNSNYFLLHGAMKWLEALFACEKRDAHLAKIRSEEQLEDVRGIISHYLVYIGSKPEFWFGGNDRLTEGNYVYVDGEPLRYYNWYPNEPNNGGNEDCMVILSEDPDYLWNDLSCTDTRWVVCEKNCAD